MDCLDNKGPTERWGLMYFLKPVNFLNQKLLVCDFKHLSFKINHHNHVTSNWSVSPFIQFIQF